MLIESVRWVGLAVVAALVVGCSRSNLSDRDVKRDQIRNQADVKRKELQVIAGIYRGSLTQSSGGVQPISLTLQIKDIPTPVEGTVDPVMTPTLSGFLRFELGGPPEAGEYIGFGLVKAEFDPKRQKVDLVASNNEYKDLVIGCTRNQGKLEGSWTAPAVATSGTITLERDAALTASESLRGEYSGLMLREGNPKLYQYGHLTIRTSVQPPEGLKVSAVMRVIFGKWQSTEYLTYRFEQVQFNPVTGQFVMKSDVADIMFTGHAGATGIIGEWYSSYTGRLGAASFKKSLDPPLTPLEGTLFEALRGTYQGKLVVTNPSAAITDKMTVSFVTSQDMTAPNGIKVTGTMRLYIGPFGSLEYKELRFTELQYNFFTRQLVGKTSDDVRLTMKASVGLNGIRGKIYEDALGEVADMDLMKLPQSTRSSTL